MYPDKEGETVKHSDIKLKRMNLLITKYCNLRCRMCDYRLNSFYVKEMTFEVIKNLLKDAKDLGLELLEISGGEPMVRKEIYEIISYAHTLELDVMMMTNGVLIGPKEAEKLVDVGLTDVVISLEGFEELNDQIRGKGNFQKAILAIRSFLELGDRMNTIGVGITVSRVNYKELYDFTRYLVEEIGVPSISYNPFTGEMLHKKNYDIRKNEFEFSSEELNDLKKELTKLITYREDSPSWLPHPDYFKKMPDYFAGKSMKPLQGCIEPQSSCGILSEGQVFPCLKGYSVGNVKETSLKEIIASEKYQKYIKLAAQGKCRGCLTSCYFDAHNVE